MVHGKGVQVNKIDSFEFESARKLSMEEVGPAGFFCGIPVEEFDKDALIGIIRFLGNENKRLTDFRYRSSVI